MTIIPKPELRAFWGDSLILGVTNRRFGRYNLPRLFVHTKIKISKKGDIFVAIHPGSLTASEHPWMAMMVGRSSFPVGMANFQGRTVHLQVGTQKIYCTQIFVRAMDANFGQNLRSKSRFRFEAVLVFRVPQKKYISGLRYVGGIFWNSWIFSNFQKFLQFAESWSLAVCFVFATFPKLTSQGGQNGEGKQVPFTPLDLWGRMVIQEPTSVSNQIRMLKKTETFTLEVNHHLKSGPFLKPMLTSGS